MRRSWIGIAAVGANQAVDHQLQPRGCLVPVDRTDDHDPMRCRPHWINVNHPVLHLAERMIWVTGAGPMAERHGGRDAGLAGMNYAPVFGYEPAEIQNLGFKLRLPRENLTRKHREPPRLRRLAGTGVLVAAGAVDEKDA